MPCLRIRSLWYEYACFEITRAMPGYARACRCLWCAAALSTAINLHNLRAQIWQGRGYNWIPQTVWRQKFHTCLYTHKRPLQYQNKLHCLQYQKWCPYNRLRRRLFFFLHLFVLTKWAAVQSVPIKATLHLAKAATICTAYLEYAYPTPSPPPRLHQLIKCEQSILLSSKSDQHISRSHATHWQCSSVHPYAITVDELSVVSA